MTGAKTHLKGLYMEQEARSGDRIIPIAGEEQVARIRLAACYRIFDFLGWTGAIFNHVTLRVPGPETIFLINPFGLHYGESRLANCARCAVIFMRHAAR
jgi:hypothetical protein